MIRSGGFLRVMLSSLGNISKKAITNRANWLSVLVMSRTRFRVNPHSVVA